MKGLDALNRRLEALGEKAIPESEPCIRASARGTLDRLLDEGRLSAAEAEEIYRLLEGLDPWTVGFIRLAGEPPPAEVVEGRG